MEVPFKLLGHLPMTSLPRSQVSQEPRNYSQTEKRRLSDGAMSGAWFRATDGERLECVLCPRKCSLKAGDRGFCFVRENRDGQIVLSTYGKSTGFCIDPIEKKPLNHFYPGTPVLSFGTAGCNLGCKFCQNWDISKSREVERLSAIAEPLTVARAASELKCTSVAFTYNDPVIWAEYAIDTARECRALGIKTVAVTAGYISPDARGDFFADMDAANVDLKAFTEEFYQKVTYSHLQPVLDTLIYLKRETAVWFEITNLIIPDANDNPGELRKMCDWMLEALGDQVPVHFTAFHPDFRMQDRDRTHPETLCMAYDIAKQTGLKYVYVGNIHDVDRQSTYCHGCGRLIVQRDWYQLGIYDIDASGCCKHCMTTIPGRFGERRGDWGSKRQPIRIDQFANTGQCAPPSQPLNVTSLTNPIRSLVQLQSKGDKMSGATPSSQPTATSTLVPPGALKLNSLTRAQRHSLLELAARTVLGAVGEPNGLRLPNPQDLLGDLTQAVIMGAFVTLKRGKILRGCCGVLGQPMQLGAAVARAAARTAKEDTRMAAISPVELPYLTIDVTLLGPFKLMTVEPAERPSQIQLGKHGLMIQSGDKSGLLLPSVALENGWDATQFLQATCRKAGLQVSAWEQSAIRVSTFDGEAIEGKVAELLGEDTVQLAPPLDEQHLNLYSQLAGTNIAAISSGSTPTYYAPGLPDMTVNAIVLSMQWGNENDGLRQANAMQVSFRPGVPLQSTLFQMCQSAAAMFQQQGYSGNLQVGVTVGIDPCMHGNGETADLAGVDSTNRAIIMSDPTHCGFAFDPSKSAEELLSILRRSLPVGSREAAVHSVQTMSSMPGIISVSAPSAIKTAGVRPPAVAGRFYPAEDAARRELVQSICKGPAPQQAAPLAVMVPHAGLKYSGQIAAHVWRSIADLDGRSLVVVSPKHTMNGLNWSVSPCESWRLSAGTAFASDTELAAKIVDGVKALELDAGAHQNEHGIEVQLPILEKVAPNVKVVGVAVHGGSWADIQQAALELAGVLRTLDKMPLLVISSDLNHYASDAENRRLDRMALDAFATCDAQRLLQTCREKDISMCGVIPAALVMETLHQLGLEFQVQELEYGTSGDISGDRSQVVGYAGALLLAR
jgi:AmmeMemoRadiSam system radical SAM enzyme/AmmeMemoRadiSam system protein B/AmmeMemoRadiSam system protein A